MSLKIAGGNTIEQCSAMKWYWLGIMQLNSALQQPDILVNLRFGVSVAVTTFRQTMA